MCCLAATSVPGNDFFALIAFLQSLFEMDKVIVSFLDGALRDVLIDISFFIAPPYPALGSQSGCAASIVRLNAHLLYAPEQRGAVDAIR
jgi:hypothetical protein